MMWLKAVIIIGFVATAHASSPTDLHEVGSFYLDPHATDKLLLVGGHKLTGKIVFQTRGTRILVNGVEWLDLAPPPPVEPTEPTRFDSTQYLPIPWIQRAMKDGKSLMVAKKEYNERRHTLLKAMVEEYRRWSHRGAIEARARALALIDTSIASLKADREAQVGENGADLYFPGYGWEGIEMPNLPPRTEPPPTVVGGARESKSCRAES